MRYWDASAVVPLLVSEDTTDVVRSWLSDDGQVATWWGTRVECVSALTRRGREGRLREEDLARAIDRLDRLGNAWSEVVASDTLRRTAIRLLRGHALRSADALQLAAAIACADGHPGSLPFVTLDDRLAEVASREGFPLVPVV